MATEPVAAPPRSRWDCPSTDRAEIQRQADAQIPLEKITESWSIGTDPGKHIAKVRELFGSGATIVNIHSGQADQKRAIDFYGSRVLPKLPQPA